MTKRVRTCKTSAIEHVRKYATYVKERLNARCYYPPLNAYRYSVALALYSKAITVAEAALVLLDAGFGDEAFGMTRTLVDIYFTMRYIANQETEERAKQFYKFIAKDVHGWAEIVKEYFPHLSQPVRPEILQTAATYPSPHSWSGKTAKDMAEEPDNFETDPATGKPAVHKIPYRIMYRWTSHFVHPTIAALKNHVVQPGRDSFTVRAMHEEDLRHLAAFNIAAYLGMMMISFYRIMSDPQPDRVAKWSGALIEHLARRHHE
jgi:hypothetical protein